MDVSFCSSLQLQENSFLFDCESLLDKPYDATTAYDPASDPGYFSAASSLSPTSSVDSFCFSPISVPAAVNERDALEHFIFGAATAAEVPPPARCSQTGPGPRPSASTRKSRSRYPGKKRQTASEREKLRMRDLTKALHHLRSYLPCSVAPAGQTLTKIETLRLAMRYISHLSAQLGLSEEALKQRSSEGSGTRPQTLTQFLGQAPSSFSAQESNCGKMSSEQPSPLHHAYQVPSTVNFSGEQLWFPQQQLQHLIFSENC